MECTVRFESNGGSPVPDQVVNYGDKLEKPDDPVRDGYNLLGWFSDFDLTRQWDFDNDTVEGNMVLYAHWTDDSLYMEDDDVPQSGIEPPELPPETDRNNTWLWITLAASVILAILLAVLLLLRKKTVDFDSDGGAPVESIRVKKGSKIPSAPETLKDGETFAGWYKGKDLAEPWDFDKDTVESNTTLFAKWQ